jgi:hypothetical protein
MFHGLVAAHKWGLCVKIISVLSLHSDFACPFLLLTGFTLQVWALAIGKKSEMLATGGRDAVLNLWYDCTADDKEGVFRKEVSCLTCYF